MNISLPEELKRYVETRIKEGYSTPSEYVRELIRDDQRRQSRQHLEELLMEGMNSGEPVRADERFWADLKAEALRAMATRTKRKAKRV